MHTFGGEGRRRERQRWGAPHPNSRSKVLRSEVVFLDNIENINSQAGHAQCVAYLTRGRHSPRLEEVERASLPDF